MLKFFLIFYLFIQAKNISSSIRNLQDSSDDIIIMHLNDVHCGVNDTIGYDGFVLYRDELKKKNPNIITVDVGDHIQGGTMGSISEGSAIIDIMNKVGFDVAILGNHEFDYGTEQLSKLKQNITSNYISSNFCYKKNKTTVFDPYKIIEIGGKKIGFIGVLTPLTFSKTYLSALKDSDGEAIYDFLTGNNTQELYDRVQKYINEVKNDKGADYVIILTHIGMDIEQYTSNELLSKLENVDAVLDGHTHLIYNTTSKDKNNKDIHISQTGTKLQSIGKLIIKKNGNISSEIIEDIPEPDDKSNAIQINRGRKDRWVNKEMYDFLNDKFKDYEDELNIQYGYSDNDLIIRPEGTTDSRYIYCRYQECSVGNLVADAFKSVGNSDISIVNGGAVRNSLRKGNLTRAQIMEVSPFFNNIIVKEVPGQCILDALEHGTAQCPEPAGGFPQVSGLTFDLDNGINSTVETDANGLFVNITGKRRVSNVKVNGENLVSDKLYKVSISDFVGNGGDGYTMFDKYDVYNESLFTDTDAVAYFIKNDLKGEIPSSYKDFQGRINIYNSSEADSTTEVITTIPLITTPQTTFIPASTIPKNETDFYRYRDRKSSGGLSTGGIIAIIIPLAVVVVAISIIALMCSNRSYQNPPIINDSNSMVISKNINP